MARNLEEHMPLLVEAITEQMNELVLPSMVGVPAADVEKAMQVNGMLAISAAATSLAYFERYLELEE